jgi:hypothetical protein
MSLSRGPTGDDDRQRRELSGLGLFKIIVSLASLIALIFWFGAAAFGIDAATRGVSLPPWYLYSLVFPFFYLSFCLISCTKPLRGRSLLFAGVVMHIGLTAWIIISVLNSRYTSIQTVGIAFAVSWILLFVLRSRSEGEV